MLRREPPCLSVPAPSDCGVTGAESSSDGSRGGRIARESGVAAGAASVRLGTAPGGRVSEETVGPAGAIAAATLHTGCVSESCAARGAAPRGAVSVDESSSGTHTRGVSGEHAGRCALAVTRAVRNSAREMHLPLRDGRQEVQEVVGGARGSDATYRAPSCNL